MTHAKYSLLLCLALLAPRASGRAVPPEQPQPSAEAEIRPAALSAPGAVITVLYSPESDIWKAQTWFELRADSAHFLHKDDTTTIEIASFAGKAIVVRAIGRNRGAEIDWELSLKNNSKGTVVGVSGPALRSIPDIPGGELYFPDRPGQRLAHPWEVLKGAAFHLAYPVPASMQYLAYAGPARGVAYHVLDREMIYKELVFGGPDRMMNVIQYPFVAPGKNWKSPPIVWQTLKGDWHEASRRYGSWFRSWAAKPQISPQVRAMPVMAGIVIKSRPVDDPNLRDVLKNQEAGTYAAALKKARELHDAGFQGSHLIGWFGQGHDTTYPDYDPSPAMGGESEFHALVDGMHQMNMLVTLYLNDRLANVNSPTFRAHPEWALQPPAGQLMHEGYGNQLFTVLCPTSGFQQRLLGILRTVAGDYHADGVQLDQVGAAASGLCFNPNHGHRTPATAWAEGYMKWLKEDRRVARTIRPEFWSWIEGAWEGAGQYVDLSQGGFWPAMPGVEYFPELYRYTLPEHPLFGDPAMGGVPYWCPTDIHRAIKINAAAGSLFWNGEYMDNIGLSSTPVAPVHWFRKGNRDVLTVENHFTKPVHFVLRLERPRFGSASISAHALAAGTPVKVIKAGDAFLAPVDVPAGQVEAVLLTTDH